MSTQNPEKKSHAALAAALEQLKKSGITKEVTRAASSRARLVQQGDEVTVHYVGRLSNGKVFDSSRERGKEFSFTLAMSGAGIIKGWEEALPTMRVGEVASFKIPSHLAYGKKGMAPKIPPNADVQYEIEVMSAMVCFVKEIVEETESNIMPKDEDYVRAFMTVHGEDGAVRDAYFQSRPLEFYMKHYSGRSDSEGRWLAGNVLRRAVQSMRLGERARFTVREPIVDKFGNAPAWAAPGPGDAGGGGPGWAGAAVLELKLVCVGRDVDVEGDQGVMKHKIVEGTGYETPTDGALLAVHYRVLTGYAPSTIRETDADAADAAAAAAAEEAAAAARAKARGGVDYSKWAKFDLASDDGELPPEPKKVDAAMLRAQEEAAKRAAVARGGTQVLFSTWEGGSAAAMAERCETDPPAEGAVTLFAGYGETAEGLEDALMTMKAGERALLAVDHLVYGFGGHDRPQPAPGLDAAAEAEGGTLMIDVTLMSISKGREHWNLSAEEKIKYATMKRERGNELFKAGRYRRALKLYQPVVSSFFTKMPERPSAAARAAREAAAGGGGPGPELMGQRVPAGPGYATALKPPAAETEEEKALKVQLQLPCLLNIAACFTKLKEHRFAAEACDRALALDPNCIKALFRRGQARMEQCKFDAAREDLWRILELDPADPDAARALARLQAVEAKSKAKEKKVFGSIFRSPAPDPADPAPPANGAAEGAAEGAAAGAAAAAAEGAAEGAAAEQEEGGDGRPRAVVTGVKRYSFDVAPKVVIAGMYSGGDGD